jgi:hypothetical protein
MSGVAGKRRLSNRDNRQRLKNADDLVGRFAHRRACVSSAKPSETFDCREAIINGDSVH